MRRTLTGESHFDLSGATHCNNISALISFKFAKFGVNLCVASYSSSNGQRNPIAYVLKQTLPQSSEKSLSAKACIDNAPFVYCAIKRIKGKKTVLLQAFYLRNLCVFCD